MVRHSPSLQTYFNDVLTETGYSVDIHNIKANNLTGLDEATLIADGNVIV